jgi:hypothetical protein
MGFMRDREYDNPDALMTALVQVCVVACACVPHATCVGDSSGPVSVVCAAP